MSHVSNTYFYINIYRFVDLKRNLLIFCIVQARECYLNKMTCSGHRLVLRAPDVGVSQKRTLTSSPGTEQGTYYWLG